MIDNHNKGLDEHGIDEDIHEAQGDSNNVENDLREIRMHLHVVSCLHTVSRDKTSVGLICSKLMAP